MLNGPFNQTGVAGAHRGSSRLRAIGLGLSAGLWLAAVTAGMAVVVDYGSAPGDAGSPVETWPAESHLPRSPGLPTLVVAAHPRCPCTRATIEELARILGRWPDGATVHVVFFRPEHAAADWAESALVARTASIPGVTVSHDAGGREARRFGAVTSGQTMLYDADGVLRFRGGITASRGHEGDNLGRSAIVSFLLHGVASPPATPVFGCSLAGSAVG